MKVGLKKKALSYQRRRKPCIWHFGLAGGSRRESSQLIIFTRNFVSARNKPPTAKVTNITRCCSRLLKFQKGVLEVANCEHKFAQKYVIGQPSPRKPEQQAFNPGVEKGPDWDT